MKEKNCPNCGSPYNSLLNACPYCGTVYFDLTSIDLTNKQPVFLKLKTLLNNKPIEVTLFMKPELKSIKVNINTTYVHSGPHNSKKGQFSN